MTNIKFPKAKNIISHIRPSDGAIQTNEEHLLNVSLLAEKFANKFDMSEWGRICRI